jgi:hypothetical protein
MVDLDIVDSFCGGERVKARKTNLSHEPSAEAKMFLEKFRLAESRRRSLRKKKGR